MIPLGKPKVDSLRIHLPLSDVTINEQHDTFFRSITSINDDGLIVDEQVKTTYFNTKEIISCSYAIKKPFGIETLYIGFSSKLLKELYFNGITTDTIQRCWNFINNEGLITISKEAFLAATVVDVDFCIDYFLYNEVGTIKEVIKVCNDLTIPNKKINAIPYTKDTNLGIQWSHRDKVGRAFKTRQYLKYYAKAIELKYNSTEFYEKYIKNGLNQTLIDLDGKTVTEGNRYFNDQRLLRVETTIKNNLHFETYGYKVKTLRDLLSLKIDKEFLRIFTRPMSQYMTGYREIKHNNEMTPGQKFKYLALINKAKHLNLDVQDVIPSVAMEIYPENSRSRRDLKRELYDIINMQEVGKKTHKHNTEVWNLFISEIERKKLIP